MACQPAVQLSVPFSVTFYAEAHLKINGNKAVPAFDIAVTLCAIDLIPGNVWPMIEENIVRRKENTDPRNRFFCNKIFVLLHNLRMLGNDVQVAEKTFLHRWESSVLRTLHKRMAETAIDGFHSRMNPVTEIDRLLGSNPSPGVVEKEIGHDAEEESGQREPEIVPGAGPLQCLTNLTLLVHPLFPSSTFYDRISSSLR